MDTFANKQQHQEGKKRKEKKGPNNGDTFQCGTHPRGLQVKRIKRAVRQIRSGPLQHSCKSYTSEVDFHSHTSSRDGHFCPNGGGGRTNKVLVVSGTHGGGKTTSAKWDPPAHTCPHLTRRLRGGSSSSRTSALFCKAWKAWKAWKARGVRGSGRLRRWGSLHHLKGLKVGQAGGELVPLGI